MSGWPPRDRESVYVPAAIPASPQSEVEQRAALAASRVREGLSVSDEILSEILGAECSTRVGIYTPAEREDIFGDRERVALAQAVLGDAEDVLGGLQVCWVDGRRGVRVLLTAEHERYRERLSERLGVERVVVERAAMNERDVRRLQASIRAQSSELEQQGVFLTRHGKGLDGLEIEYLAWDPVSAEVTLRERFGDEVTLRYRGASNHTFSEFPFCQLVR